VSFLRTLKLSAFSAAERTRLFARVGASRWRQDRLLILCYHGVALRDEHEWSEAHVSEAHLARRLQMLRDDGCSILSLSDAVERLAARELPPRSVVLTFDEGMYDFYVKAYPLLRAHDAPATVYVPTYYTTRRHPIFDLGCSYLLWRGRGQFVDTGRLLASPRRLRIPTEQAARDALHLEMRAHVNEAGFPAREKDEMLAALSAQIGVDWNAFLSERMLQLMSPDELASLDRRLVDVQLHTHRHRTPRRRGLFVKELHDNVMALEAMGFQRDRLRHFCYPSGDADPQFYPWLSEMGIKSATTCEPNYATRARSPFDLPRLVDTMRVTDTEFRAWTSGVAAWMPRRRHSPPPGEVEPPSLVAADADGAQPADFVRPRGAVVMDSAVPIPLHRQTRHGFSAGVATVVRMDRRTTVTTPVQPPGTAG
jgi:peptidoglycan/xylan/chitin deacetylase (PgdA/CDA1 family)